MLKNSWNHSLVIGLHFLQEFEMINAEFCGHDWYGVGTPSLTKVVENSVVVSDDDGISSSSSSSSSNRNSNDTYGNRH